MFARHARREADALSGRALHPALRQRIPATGFASYKLLNVGRARMQSIEAPTAAVLRIERRRRPASASAGLNLSRNNRLP